MSAEPTSELTKALAQPTRVVPKTDEAKDRIRAAIKDNILFLALEDQQRAVVIDAMEERTVPTGTEIITYGTSRLARACGSELVKQPEQGELVPEKARPTLWWLVRACAHARLAVRLPEHACCRCASRLRFCRTHSLGPLGLGYHEPRLRLSSARPLVSMGENSKSAGDDGDYFYVLERGNAEVFVPKLGPDPVMTYSSGASFGELALMYNCPRAATVKVRAPSDARVRFHQYRKRLYFTPRPLPSRFLLPWPSLGAGLTCVNGSCKNI